MLDPDQAARPEAPPWGAYRPDAWERALINACRGLPLASWASRLKILLRRPVKYGRATPLDVEVWGLRLRLHRRGNFSETALLFGPHCFDPVELEFLRDRLRPGAVFLDIGANAAAYSFWVCSVLGGACTVLTVEPDPELLSRVRFNIAQNNCPGMVAIGVAVGDRPGGAAFTINPQVRGQNSLLGNPDADGMHGIRVEVRTLTQLVTDAGLTRIDAMKVDVEGVEEAVLGPFFDAADASVWPKVLILESKETEEHRRLGARLEGLGYRTLRRAGLNLILERV